MDKLENEANIEFASRLKKQLDQELEGNQSALARAVEVTPQAVNKWLAGAQIPNLGKLRKVAATLNTTQSYLLFGVEPPPAPKPDEHSLDYLDRLERELLTHFREGTAVGKKQLLVSASHIEKKPASELPAKASSALH